MGSAIQSAYPKSMLNATLSRWLRADIMPPKLDCVNCARPAKCCAFQPFVPNFLLGGWLLERGSGSLPLGVEFHPIGAVASTEYRARHGMVPEDQHGVEFLCGFFDRESRGCSLWNYRPGECSSYFCDSERVTLPRREVSERTFAMESAVAQMALVELGFEAREISSQVDLLNGEAGGALGATLYPVPELLLMYKKAWNWCQTLSPEEARSWISPPEMKSVAISETK